MFDVEVDRIKACGKTTLMVRNIPNKYTQDMMIQMINERFRGTYDFFYLPIDFNVLFTRFRDEKFGDFVK